MDILFSNDTTLEKVITFAAISKENSIKLPKLLLFIYAGLIASGIAMFFFLPSNLRVASLLYIIPIICGVVIDIRRRCSKSRGGSIGNAGMLPTGEKNTYHYDFTLNGFNISGAEEAAVTWKDIMTVRDIGAAFQIKCEGKSYTIKKNGFENGVEKKFRDLLISNDIYII